MYQIYISLCCNWLMFSVSGYSRILLALVSFYFMPHNHIIACFCYVLSALLDAVDGHAARIFNQSTLIGLVFLYVLLHSNKKYKTLCFLGSKFGAMLDQLTDRCGTTGLLVTLCYFYPKYMFWFQLSIAVDISCHWLFLHV